VVSFHEALSRVETGSVAFLDVGIDVLTYQDMFVQVETWLKDKSSRSHHIACNNAYNVTLARTDTRLRDIYNTADISGPDGMPFVRWIRAFHKRPCDRFCAPDVVAQLAERARENGYTFYLYGGSPEVLQRMTGYMRERFPHIFIVGSYSPPFRPLTVDEDDTIVKEMNRLRPDILLVGLGTPKQDYWIDDHLGRVRGSVMIASGATFDFFGGRIRMAPSWIQKSGFEWLFRLFSKDFKRLWKRYTIMNLVFVWSFFWQILGVRRTRAVRRYRQ
jgi:N-acetylglucosaminyldiphosphoundecaprenol N-acetyl-beta-D-mannosaminyltransferase